jgi:hypothetical protein
VLILNSIPEARGWSPIQHMILLAAEIFDAQVIPVDNRQPSSFRKAFSFLQKRSADRPSQEPCLHVCTGPSDLAKILNIRDWRKRFGPIGAWVIDSFWTDHIPRMMPFGNLFDFFFVTSLEDLDTWKQLTGVPTTWLPWGTDALRLGSGAPFRNWDITRVGRQPPEWEEDQSAAQAAARLGINYRPRPASVGLNTVQNQRLMMDVYGDTKYVLAFSNAVNPEPYTHPTRQYLTGRWVDGLAGGAVLAGVPPKEESIHQLLWQGATLDFDTIRLDLGLKALATALPHWKPELALNNYAMALRKLDWRWRFKVLADSFGLRPVLLENELNLLKERIASVGSGGSAS